MVKTILEIYVFRPESISDLIYPIESETNTHYISVNGLYKIPKKIVDTEKSWHKNYYFSSKDKEKVFCEKYYKEG